MNDSARDLLVTGLRNAHAMENQAEELMERQISRMTDYPDIHARLEQHLAETRLQKKRLEECLHSCGENPSTIKDMAMSLTGNLAALTHAMAQDEVLKNTFANNAFEHYEIAAYKSLLTLSSLAGVNAIRSPLEQSLREEEQMAAWVDAHIDQVTRDFVTRQGVAWGGARAAAS
jgi:ferritin-like metal-binding protein YciE